MPIVIAKCTECNSVLKVDTVKKADVCGGCNKAFVVEEAIDNYVRNFDIINSGNSKTSFAQATNRSDFEIVSGILKSYKGESENVIIPQNVNEIGSESFAALNVRKVLISERVRKIGNSAFRGCEYLNNIVIPESVKVIDYNAFEYCRNLRSVKLNSKMRNMSKDKYLDFMLKVFGSTPFLKSYSGYKEYLEGIKMKKEKERWIRDPNLCNACGESMIMKGIIKDRYVCSVCGRENYYTCSLCGRENSKYGSWCSKCIRALR